MKIITSPHSAKQFHSVDMLCVKIMKLKNQESNVNIAYCAVYPFNQLTTQVEIDSKVSCSFDGTPNRGSGNMNPLNFGCYGKTITKQILI